MEDYAAKQPLINVVVHSDYGFGTESPYDIKASVTLKNIPVFKLEEIIGGIMKEVRRQLIILSPLHGIPDEHAEECADIILHGGRLP